MERRRADFNITSDVSAPDYDKVANSNTIFIRHGTTMFNVEFSKYGDKEESKEFMDMCLNTNYVDLPLNEIGLAQCVQGAAYLDKINI